MSGILHALGWLVLAVYVVGFLLCWRTSAWLMAHDGDGNSYREIEGFDVIFGLIFGAVIALFWPVVVPVRILYIRGVLTRTSEGIHARFMRPPKSEREKALRLRAEKQERRIEELERKVGLR